MDQFLSRNTQVRKIVEGRASTDMLQMLMRRELGFSEEEYLECFAFTLNYDDLHEDSRMRIQGIDDAVKTKYVGKREASAGVVEYLVKESFHENNSEVMAAIAQSKWTSEELMIRIAEKAPANVLEKMTENPLPLVATPEIMEKMEKNPQCNGAVKEKLDEIRHIFFESPAAAAPAPEAAAIATPLYGQVPTATVAASPASAEGGLDQIKVAKESLTMFQKISLMSISDKIRLAFKGARSERMVLMKDPNRMVQLSVIESPKTTDDEVISYVNDRSVPGEIIQKIAESREWTRHYPVVLALAQNPKVPIHRATAFIKQLHERDLKALVLDRNINPVVRQLAIGYFKTRNIGKR